MNVDKKLQPNAGIILTIVLSFIPMFAWKFGHTFEPGEVWRAIAFSAAKVGAFGGMAMFALSLILSGRYSFYDKLFGGLDKMYIAHRFLGTFSLILLFIHPLSLSLLALEGGMLNALSLWFKVSDVWIWLGAMAFYALLSLVIWSIFTRSKYETFVKVHRLMGLVFIAGAAHAFMAGSILASNSFMYWYLLTLTAAGTVTFVIYSVFGDLLHRPYGYKLKKVTRLPGGVVEVRMAPKSRIISFRPGQFVYISFTSLSEHGFHPFSISSSRRSSELVLAMRMAGDFTEEVAKLKVGSEAFVKGPYGGFTLELNARRKQLWVAGGIGVTPFISGAESLRDSNRMTSGDIEMIYATSDKKPYGIDALQAVEDNNKIFNVTLFDQDTFGHVSFELLSQQIKDIPDRDIYICGPPPMLNALRAEAERGGFESNLKYEEFGY